MARIRTFIAVDVGAEVRKRAAALQQQLTKTGAEVKWVAPDQMHLTLLFLGDVDELEVLKVCRAVQEVAGREPPFPLLVYSSELRRDGPEHAVMGRGELGGGKS